MKFQIIKNIGRFFTLKWKIHNESSFIAIPIYESNGALVGKLQAASKIKSGTYKFKVITSENKERVLLIEDIGPPKTERQKLAQTPIVSEDKSIIFIKLEEDGVGFVNLTTTEIDLTQGLVFSLVPDGDKGKLTISKLHK